MTKQAGLKIAERPLCFHAVKAESSYLFPTGTVSYLCISHLTTTERELCGNQPHALQLAGMNRPALHGVDACGVDAGVTQDVRQPGQVALYGVIRSGEQMAEIVGEHLGRLHSSAFAQAFHVPPDVGAVKGPPRPRHEHRPADVLRPGGDFLCPEIVPEQAAQLGGQEHDAPLSFVDDFRPASGHGPNRDEPQLGHPDAGGADGLDDEGEALVFLSLCGANQSGIFGAGQLPALVAKQGLLDLQQPDRALPPAHPAEKAVDGGQHGIDGSRGVGGGQRLLPGNQRHLGDRGSVQMF